ncbi:MAG: hypothetical protein HQL07_14620 [Nitrospirae bacterium]|nr:hypothetical protein [Magnetococcales bacterium]
MDFDGADDQNKLKQFLQMLKSRKGKRHAVVMQDFPDPNAISCAWAWACRQIVATLEIETDLIYGGRISHQENRILKNYWGNPSMSFPNRQSTGLSVTAF